MALSIEMVALNKSYGSRVALSNVNLTVTNGEILALLGPNGAGKSTIMSIVAGLRAPDAGTVLLNGKTLGLRSTVERQEMGFVPQDLGLYPVLTVIENLKGFAAYTGLRGKEQVAAIELIVHELDLGHLLTRQVRHLSGGEKRRVHTAAGLVHQPKVLLLDEPTLGADADSRARILSAVTKSSQRGSAVLYSTHFLHEAEILNASVAILERGEVLVTGGLAELVNNYGHSAVEIAFSGQAPQCRHGRVTNNGRTLIIESRTPERAAAQVVASLGPKLKSVRSIDVMRANLESVYLAVVGRRSVEQDDDWQS